MDLLQTLPGSTDDDNMSMRQVLLSTHFADEKTEAQEGKVTCMKYYNHEGTVVDSNPGTLATVIAVNSYSTAVPLGVCQPILPIREWVSQPHTQFLYFPSWRQTTSHSDTGTSPRTTC